MSAVVTQRVQLPQETGSAAGATSRTRTLSRCGSDGEKSVDGGGALSVNTGPVAEPEDLRDVVARLEELQMRQRSPQQPIPELDALLARVLAQRPEFRPRMAVLTKSALLRKKILSAEPAGGRQAGSAMLGTTFPWRKDRTEAFSDSNWPKVATHSEHGLHHLPGGSSKHDGVLRCPADKIPMNPLLSHTPYHSVPSTKRFPGTHHNGELNKKEVQKRGTPGPGAYSKSVPRGTAFSVDGGETIVLGANHVCPWKKALGRQINPIDVDATSLTSAPCYSFSKTRRTCSDTIVGHGVMEGGPVKSDYGGLSPGPVYEHFGSMRPLTNPTLGFRKRSRSTGSLTRIRCHPVEPEITEGTDGGEEF
mmetsp:Transcript_13856/g.29002  ORF Transcript_13856/g.29002 Transcript_13856/m.29002 type:complete len:363 (+) Transcript_13856:153-1241(+)